MAEQKIKVSELSEQEQKDLIAEAYAVGLKGIFTTWNIDTLKKKIAEAKGEENISGILISRRKYCSKQL